MRRTILHIDMDAFFASVEQRVNPALRNRPIAVCGANSRTVVLTASYEARSRGVRTGMTVPEAMALCPELLLVESHHDRYTDVCRRLLAIYESYSPQVEVFSVDEVFMDLSGSLVLFESAEAVARSIKHRIGRELGLTASIGIAPNKLLAKLAGGLSKPDGLMTLGPEEAVLLLEGLPVDKLCGIGPSTSRKLSALGIMTCGELGRAPLELLVHHFGILGHRLREMGQGRDESPVAPAEEEPSARSIGHSMTLEKNVSDRNRLETCLLQLSEGVGRRLRGSRLSGRVVSLTVRYADFTTFTRQSRIGHDLNDDLAIYRAARKILIAQRLAQPVRLLGVSVSDLTTDIGQIPLFEEDRRRKELLSAMDRINDRHGTRTLFWGTLLKRDPHRPVISPAWRPGGSKEHC